MEVDDKLGRSFPKPITPSVCPMCSKPLEKKISVTLSCGHCFCAWCIKYVARKATPKCPFCRACIPDNLVSNPMLKQLRDQFGIDKKCKKKKTEAETFFNLNQGCYKWYCIGPGKIWCQYDPKSESVGEVLYPEKVTLSPSN